MPKTEHFPDNQDRADDRLPERAIPLVPIDPTLTFCLRDSKGYLETIDALKLSESERDGFQSGTLLDGRYRIEQELGRGGMGRVFLARDERLQRQVAVKVMLSSTPSRGLGSGRSWERMFADEARLGARLLHPAIAQVLDYGFHRGMPYAIFEHLAGSPLRELLQKHAPLSIQDIRVIVGPLAQALDYAHQRRIVHRDLKPENIRATEQGQFKILDLGLAKRFDHEEGDWGFAGTPAYAAPEQAAELPSDGRADQYALGVIVFEMLTGHRPFTARTPRELLRRHQTEAPPSPRQWMPELPESLCAIVLRSLEKDPQKRFGSCEEFAAALGCQFLSSATPLPATVLEQSVRVVDLAGRLAVSEAVYAARLLLLSDTLWFYCRGGICRWHRSSICAVDRSPDGQSLQVTVLEGEKRFQHRWSFPSSASCAAWYQQLNQGWQDAADSLPPSAGSRNPHVFLVTGRPRSACQLLGNLGTTADTLWSVEASLILRAAVAGADAVIDVTRERCLGWPSACHHWSGRLVKVVSAEARSELDRTCLRDSSGTLATALGGMAARLVVSAIALYSVSLWLLVALEGGGGTSVELLLAMVQYLAIGVLAPLALWVCWPWTLGLLARQWPHRGLIRVWSQALLVTAAAPLLGQLLAGAMISAAAQPGTTCAAWLAGIAGYLLSGLWLVDHSVQVSNLERTAVSAQTPPRRGSRAIRVIHGINAIFAVALLLLPIGLTMRWDPEMTARWRPAFTPATQGDVGSTQLVHRPSPTDAEIKISALEAWTRKPPRLHPQDFSRRLPPRPEDLLPLFDCLDDPVVEVRVAACKALGKPGPATPSMVEALASRLLDEEPAVRDAANTSLQRIIRETGFDDLRAATPHLIGLLFRAEGSQADRVADVLKRIDPGWRESPLGSKTLSQADTLLTSDRIESRIMATRVLRHLGPAAVSLVPRLLKGLLDEDANVRDVTWNALDRVSPDWQDSELVWTMLPDLRVSVQSSDIGRCLTAIRLLGRMGRTSTELRFSRESGNYLPPERTRDPAPIVPVLLGALAHDSPDVRLASIEALGAIGPGAAAAVPELMRLAGDPFLERAAVSALHRIQGR
jgi:serine/threonine protein kinase/HEAT repeat protein